MFKFLSFIFLCRCLIKTSAAQSTGLPSIDTILGENVDVIAIQPVVDNLLRTLSIYWGNQWITLPYPDYLNRIGLSQSYDSEVTYPLIAQRPDGTYIFLESLEDTHSFQPWIAYPESERMYRIDSPCNSTEFSFYNPWVYVYVVEETYLCNWITGESSPALPERLAWGATRVGFELVDQPDLSPEGGYLVLRAPFSGGNIYGDRIYSYHLETRSFAPIGDVIGSFDIVGLVGWLTPTTFVIGACNMPEWSTRNRYVGDVQVSNSLNFAINMLRFSPMPVQDPPGLMVMDAAMRDGFTPGPCFVEFYDVTTRLLSQYDTGALCEYGLPIPDGSGDQLYRAVYPSAVVRYNFFTGRRRNLYVGEVETLGPIAPDGSLGLVGLGNNGVVESQQDPDANFGVPMNPAEYVVMNLNTGEILGRVPADVEWISSDYLHNQEQLFAVTPDAIHAEALRGEVVLTYSQPPAMLLETADNELQFHDLTDGTIESIAHLPTGYNAVAYHRVDDVIRLTLYSTELPTMTFDIRLL